jgi:hypothetical protein
MIDSIFGVSLDLIFLGGVFLAFGIVGFVRGAQFVSEIGIALILASFLLPLTPMSLIPQFVINTFISVHISLTVGVFIILSLYAWWIMRHTNSSSYTVPRMARIIPAALGVTLVIVYVMTRVVPTSGIYTLSSFTMNIASHPFFFLLIALSLLALSRKV